MDALPGEEGAFYDHFSGGCKVNAPLAVVVRLVMEALRAYHRFVHFLHSTLLSPHTLFLPPTHFVPAGTNPTYLRKTPQNPLNTKIASVHQSFRLPDQTHSHH